MKINIDELLANMPKEEETLKTVQTQHKRILSDNREKEKQRKARNHWLCEHGGLLSADHLNGQRTVFCFHAGAGCWPVTTLGAFRG